MSEDDFEKIKANLELLKNRDKELNLLIQKFKENPLDLTAVLSFFNSIKSDIIQLYLLSIITTLWLSEVESKSEDRTQNIELLNQILADSLEKGNRNEALLKKLQEYFQDMELKR
ncbi:MAG: hypothetical protein M0T81_04090 [Thermoplasmatales archaeon]|nr:hypothetical protein [Thermoplasmatales archaeon]